MIRSLIMLAKSLGMKVIAEGVETRGQLDLIEDLGGNEVQGYLLGKPSPEPMAILEAHRKGRNSELCLVEGDSVRQELVERTLSGIQ